MRVTHCEILGASFTLHGLQLILPVNEIFFSDSQMLRRIISKFKLEIYFKKGGLKGIKGDYG